MEVRVAAPTYFLEDGGKMGELIRSKDWSATSLGPVENWPHSLKTTISLVLHSAYPMFIWWSKELIMFHNDAYLPVLGKKSPDALGKNARIVWSEVWQDIGPLVDDVFRGGSVFMKDLPLYLGRKGFLEETYWTFSYSPILNEEGQVDGLFCACNEETEKILGQRRLNTSEKIAAIHTHQHTVEQVCKGAVEILDENRNDVPFSLLYLVDEQNGEMKLIHSSGLGDEQSRSVICNGRPNDLWDLSEIKNCCKPVFTNQVSNEIRNFLPNITSAAILPLQKGGTEELSGFLICGVSPSLEFDERYKSYFIYTASQISTAIADVSTFEYERKKAQALLELAQSKEKAEKELHNLFMEAPVGIIILRGPNHIVELVNEFYCLIVKRNKEELLGRSVFDVIPEAIEQGYREIINGVRISGEPLYLHEHETVLHRNGKDETTYLSFVFQPLKELNDEVERVMVLVHEVADQVLARKNMEDLNLFLEQEVNQRTKALKQANAELERSNKELEQFAYAASHDMQEPLRKIQTFASFLTDNTESISEVKRKYISKIQESAKRMSGIIDDLLNYSHQTTEIQFVTKDLNKIVQDVIFDLELMINQKGAILTHENLPSVQTIAGQMHQLFYNLINNALKFSKEDVPPRIHISCSILDEGRYVEITVKDNGIGFEAEYADKIFQLFKRLNDRKSYSGSGIGLALCKKIVSNHGGTIRAESQLGEGASFIIRLPVEQNK